MQNKDLINEAIESILDNDLNTMKENLMLALQEKAIEKLEEYFMNKEHALETAYANSQLPNTPNEDAIKTLLLESLEAHYGSLTAAVVKDTDISRIVNDLKAIVERYQQ